MELLTEHLGRGLGLALLLSLPCVLTAAAVGLVIGILQAVTQVQEQTIAAAPKILAVFLIILLGGGLMMNMLTAYVRESMVLAFQEIPRSEEFLLPPRSLEPDKTRIRKFFKEQATTGKNSLEMMSNSPGFDKAGSEGKNTSGMGVTITKPGSPLGIGERMTLQKQQQNKTR